MRPIPARPGPGPRPAAGAPAPGRPGRRARAALVNAALGGLLLVAVVTGLGSWLVATGVARPLTFAHAAAGFGLLILTPLKVRGPVRSGFRAHRVTRWVSAAFGVTVLATIVLGILHSTGTWSGVGPWTALWTHLLLGFVIIPVAVWHVRARRSRLRRTDLGRRALLSGAVLAGAASVAVVVQGYAVRASGLAGAGRGPTGSLELSSYEPAGVPFVSWLDDAVPTADLDTWRLRIDGEEASVPGLADRARPLTAYLDCTGGWRSAQHWDVVALADVLPDRASRSVRVTSSTGYSRLFDRTDCDRIYLCTGYAGRPLARGHGAPVRVVAPGRRGPWWVKWVTEVELTDRPAWLQPPLPLT